MSLTELTARNHLCYPTQYLEDAQVELGENTSCERCTLRDGTRHFTLLTLKGLTASQAAAVRFATPPPLPLQGVALTRVMPWFACLVLGVDAPTAHQVLALCDQLSGRDSHWFPCSLLSST